MAEGFDGLLDFIGYPVGAEPPPQEAGFVGLLDFAGYPVGEDTGAPPAAEVPRLALFRVGQ